MSQNASRLYFGGDGGFRILQLTDLHYDGSDAVQRSNAEVSRKLLAFEQPDFVVLSGDMVSGYAWDGREQDWYQRMHAAAVAPVVAASLPWAVVVGNHDTESGTDAASILRLDSSMSSLSRTLRGPQSPNGTDYLLPVWVRGAGRGADADAIGAVLAFMYSGRDECLGVPKWGCVTPAQASWLNQSLGSMLAEAAAGSGRSAASIPVAVFLHIPPPPYMDVRNQVAIHGTVAETVGCPSVDTGLLEVFRQRNVVTVQAGHDHLNDFWGSIGGVAFLYGKKTGYGSYGPARGVPHGGRMLKLTAFDRTFETWIRTEDGAVDAQIDSARARTRQLHCDDAALEGDGGSIEGALVVLPIVIVLVALAALGGMWKRNRHRQRPASPKT
ncbi:hypothetical protein HK105_206900 [Polyrhizophydium stewartii]|uniref:Calcineurin-like phosphoesterase domain-containing protein n=1 Tax=Polyrhizophydium stewartii TaxID=2732419 RepID=A0ABR4N236_9FUNG|nr:purple acid phosphatase [Polyrhizophydium stewartii]